MTATKKPSPAQWRVSPAFLRQLALGIGFTVVTAVLLFWLAGAFHPRIDRDGGRPAASAGAAAPGRRLAADARTEPVRRIRVPARETAVGTIRAVHEASVASKLLAKVTEVRIKAGDRVKKGEVLARLDDADLAARLQQAKAAAEQARARHEQAKIEHERIRNLHAAGSASPIELDRVTTGLKTAAAEQEQAEQAVREAETTLAYATITAPIDGLIVDKRVETGDTVTPGQILLTLYDPTRMQLVAQVRESLTRRLAVGQSIGVMVESLGKVCEGQVSEIVPEAETASRTFAVKVTGPCPEGIYSGMFGRLLIPLDEEEVLAVPRAAIRRVGQLEMVEVVDGDAVRRRTVQTGRPLEAPHDGLVEVLSGVREGESVVVPANAAADGARR